MNSKTGSIAVLGANGRLGREAVHAFHEAGWRVRAVSRTGNGDFPQGVEQFAADAGDEAQVIAATRGVDFIFNALNPLYPAWQREVMVMARNVIAAAHANDAVHLFPGNVYNYGTALPQELTDETPERPDHKKARIRAEAERFFAEAAETLGVQTIVIRAGDYYGGDGRGSWFDLIIAPALKRGKVTYPGPRDVVHSWAYLPDFARSFVAIAQNARGLSRFERFNFGGHNVTGNELVAALETATGRKLKVSGFPWPLLRIGGIFHPMWREVGEMAYLWQRPHRMNGERLETVTGPLRHTPLVQALRQSLRQLDLPVAEEPRHSHAMPSMAS
ncbi:MAG: NmrA family NAD(P)-binding protein [Nitratireductor sp.]|nr:NmrA family NAD(P)-binding protein [Nitratireductor sp.]